MTDLENGKMSMTPSPKCNHFLLVFFFFFLAAPWYNALCVLFFFPPINILKDASMLRLSCHFQRLLIPSRVAVALFT